MTCKEKMNMKKIYNIPATEVAFVGMVTNLCAVSEHPKLNVSESTDNKETVF